MALLSVNLVVVAALCGCALGAALNETEERNLELGNVDYRPGLDDVEVNINGPAKEGWSRLPQGTNWANLAWEVKRDDIRHIDVVDVDLFDVKEAVVQEHKRKGRTVICYTSAGTMESWRPDKDSVPSSVMGLKYHNKNSERWFDIRQWEKLKDLMNSRLNIAAKKKCDAVEFDNVDCYANNCVKNGKRASLKDYQVAYCKWLANKAHSKGMAAGFKNAVDLVVEMVQLFDFAINESCTRFNECRYYQPFKDVNKAVFGVEYDSKRYKEACVQARLYGIAMKVANGGSWRTCNIN